MPRTRLIKSDVLDHGLQRDIRRFERGAKAAATKSAERATAKSRAQFRYKRPITNLSRPKRPSTQGSFTSTIRWRPEGDGTNVGVDVARLPIYWLIQEIGTGKSASVGHIRGGQGRSGPREKGSVSVASQVGRVLPRGLIWSGDNPRKDQIEPRQGRSGPRITIRREIQGKGYLRVGGNAGFALYEREMEAAFRRAFGHHSET